MAAAQCARTRWGSCEAVWLLSSAGTRFPPQNPLGRSSLISEGSLTKAGVCLVLAPPISLAGFKCFHT